MTGDCCQIFHFSGHFTLVKSLSNILVSFSSFHNKKRGHDIGLVKSVHCETQQ